MRIANILQIVLFSRAPRRFSFYQSVFGVYLWCEGASQDAITMMNKLGMSLCVKSVRAKADKLAVGHDHELVLWQQARQVGITKNRNIYEQ